LRLGGLPKVHKVHVQFVRALLDGGRPSARDETSQEPHPVSQRKSLAILGIEHLHLAEYGHVARFGCQWSDQAHAAVRQSSIDIHQEQFDLAGSREHGGINRG